jgi:hypothetical protein
MCRLHLQRGKKSVSSWLTDWTTFAEVVCQQLRPQGSWLPRLYGLPMIHKSGIPLRSTVTPLVPAPIAWPNTWRAYLAATLATPHITRCFQWNLSTSCVLSGLTLRVYAQFRCGVRVPIQETIDLLGWQFEEDILRFSRHVLTTSNFSFNDQFCGQEHGDLSAGSRT